MPHYVPRVSAERVEQLRRWHEDVSSELHARPTADIEYLGLQLRVPQGVFAPTPTSDLLGNLVSDQATPGLRVLDMGCGAGANAENYATLTAFLHDVPGRLRPGGAVLLFFGTSGDVAYLDERISANGLLSATVAERTITVRGELTTYFVRRLTIS
ncbi:MAG TPA: hypothetical protein VK853_07560 [Ilumatobacteraceae bacterium]|nr:hypothetical protein [Ilumatobacteraceae bacterium]